MFARPGGNDAQARVIPGPAAGPPSAAEIEGLLEQAAIAACEGLVKHTYVLDAQTRVRIDARFGKAKLQRLDAPTVDKMMGGKDRSLRPDQSADLLRVIGIMNADGSISAKHAKKYKQVNHFVEICRPMWEAIAKARTVSEDDPLRVLDLGCGNGYLTFVLAEALRLQGTAARIHGLDRREDLVARCRERAESLGWTHVSFGRSAIAEVRDPDAAIGGRPDLVVALHACDTATDDALALGMERGATAILAAPCCQHELAEQLPKRSEAAASPALLRQGLLRQEYAALLTDALRVQILEACDYHVDLLEFVHGTHTPKNLLIRARRRHPEHPADAKRWNLSPITEQCATLGIHPHLLERLSM